MFLAVGVDQCSEKVEGDDDDAMGGAGDDAPPPGPGERG